MPVLRPPLSSALLAGTTILSMNAFAKSAPPQGCPVSVPLIDCDAFVRDGDGSWTSTVRSYVMSRNARRRIDPETRIVKGAEGSLGFDLAASLEQACHLY